MSNQPQCPVEEIDLIPHPMDAWRAALNALIAVAPGDSADIAYHLDDARKCTLICRDFSAASQGEAKLIDRLMLLGAGKLVGNRLDTAKPNGEHNAFGFTHHARLIGDHGQPSELATPIGAEPADMPTLSAAIQACPSLLVPEARQASACCSCAHPGAGHQALRSPPVQSSAAATPLTTHSAVPQAPQSYRS